MTTPSWKVRWKGKKSLYVLNAFQIKAENVISPDTSDREIQSSKNKSTIY